MEGVNTQDWFVIFERLIVPIVTSIIAFGGIAYSVRKTINNNEKARNEQYEHERNQNAKDRGLSVKQDVIKWRINDLLTLSEYISELLPILEEVQISILNIDHYIENKKTKRLEKDLLILVSVMKDVYKLQSLILMNISRDVQTEEILKKKLQQTITSITKTINSCTKCIQENNFLLYENFASDSITDIILDLNNFISDKKRSLYDELEKSVETF